VCVCGVFLCLLCVVCVGVVCEVFTRVFLVVCVWFVCVCFYGICAVNV